MPPLPVEVVLSPSCSCLRIWRNRPKYFKNPNHPKEPQYRAIPVMNRFLLAATVFRNRAQEGRKGRHRGRERRCLPVSFVVKHGIENYEELAHAGGKRRLGIFPARPQLGVKILDD